MFLSALLGFVAFGIHTEEEYWAGWQKFLSLESAQERHNFYRTKAEHDQRFEIFKENMEKIRDHNNGNHSWTMGITQFSDMTSKEFKAYVACGSIKNKSRTAVHNAPEDWSRNAPYSIDW